MAEFQIKLADQIIEISSLYTDILDMCKNYLCEEGKPDFRIVSSEEEIAFERKKNSAQEEFSDAYLETLAVYRAIAGQMLRFSTFLIHGSVVAVAGEAFMFTAPSGVGKTTRTTMWLEQIENSYIVNGDKPLLKVTDTEVLACGTPWCGKENLNTNVNVPLRAIIFLERAEKVSMKKIPFSEAFLLLLRQTYRSGKQEEMVKTLGLLKQLNRKVEFYKYDINLEDTDMCKIYKIITGHDR